MTSRLRSRPFVVTAAVAVAIFLAVLVLLSVRMAGGQDPALGARTPASTDRSLTQAQVAPEPAQPAYDPYADDDGYGGYDGGYDDGGSAQGAYGDQSAVPQTQQAPLQSGTS